MSSVGLEVDSETPSRTKAPLLTVCDLAVSFGGIIALERYAIERNNPPKAYRKVAHREQGCFGPRRRFAVNFEPGAAHGWGP